MGLILNPYISFPAGGSSLNTNLTAGWKLEESAGATRVDSVGTNDLTDVNTVGQNVSGIIGNSAQFTHASQHRLKVARNSSIPFDDSDWSFAIWAYHDGNPGQYGRYFNALNLGGNGGVALYYERDTTQKLYLGAFNNSIADIGFVRTGNTITANAWHCAIVRHEASSNTLSIRLNADSVNSVVLSESLPSYGGEFQLGALQGDSSYFYQGELDNAYYWQKVLSTDEMDEFYNSGNGVEYPF